MISPDGIHIVMITGAPLRTRGALERLLDAFEGDSEMAPTNWGPDERARNPYDREEMIREITETEDFHVPGLRRAKPPRYQAYFWANNNRLKMVKVEFGSSLRKKDPALIFGLGNSLANALEPEYGFVHIIWRQKVPKGMYNATSVMTADKFKTCGPKPPAARTWFGPHLVKLIGMKRLNDLDVPIMKTSWGGVQFDLVPDPWESDYKTLNERQSELREQLDEEGVFGDYTDWHDCKPGPGWKPVLEKGGD